MRLPGFLVLFLLLFTTVIWTSSCTLLKRNGSKTIVTIDGSPISTEEFLYVYNKNNLNEKPATREEILDYLELFVNFKLKVKEAEGLELHLDSAFIRELEGYRKQLASPYLTETRLLDSLVKVTYQRLKEEVNASHILIGLPNDAKAADTLAAFNKITDLRTRIMSGASFAQIAQEFSEDPSAKQNYGNLGYFSAMQMVYPFEEAAYSLAIDSISKPIRTSFGYHIIQLHDRRASQGKIQVSHILVRALDSLDPIDSTLAAERANEIYKKAINKDDWSLLCRQFSEDVGTKNSAGTLPWFKTGDISNIPAFEKAAFALEKVGDISEPVKTVYGWHIIRLDGRQTLEPFEQIEPKIRTSLSTNSRKHLNQQELVKRLKSENNYLESRKVIDEALSHGNDSLSVGNWHPNDQWGNYKNVMFSIGENSYKVEDYYQYVEHQQPFKSDAETPFAKMKKAFDEFSKECLIEYEEAHLADKYYDYRMLLKEYRDGILLFQLMESKVWNQAVADTSGLKQYFKEHQDQYQWQSRAVADIFNVVDEKALKEVKEFVDLGYFSYNKYDFYGSKESLNKAQLKILDNVSQKLLQAANRSLLLQYATKKEENQQIQHNILGYLTEQGINSDRIVISASESGAEEFLLFVISNSKTDLEKNMNSKNPLTIQVESGKFERGDNPLVDQVKWQTGTTTLEVDNRLVLVKIDEILAGGAKDLDEIRGQVISDYQTQLESDWVLELRAKYMVDIHENQVDAVYEQYND